ncbi:hypothetical protein [Rubripirellula obstinata]|uniref:hypothetical protein n=1 Tax=Rubripirellula obstinata TaxID=406547 RepID=UPI00122CAD92|nr:hypothetical protein [Rubripirellula obstinata]
MTRISIDDLDAFADTKPFAPQHDYDAYNAVIAKTLQTKTEPSFDEKFQRYADYYDTLMQTRRQLATCTDEARIKQKRKKIQLHTRLVQIYRTLDDARDGE